MPECRYCGKTFESEEAELDHLRTTHRDELSPIDERRISKPVVESEGNSVGILIIGVTILLTVGIVAYVGFFAGDNGEAAADGQPYNIGQVHDHGTMEIIIDGEQLDLESPDLEYHPAFHFHQGYRAEYGADIYHLHADGVTVQYAIESLGLQLAADGSELTYDGETYRDSDPDTEIVIEVNGEAVHPGTYVLSGVGPESQAAQGNGDDVRIEVIVE